jgi:uncharacterized repeat protein (TIGR01451 family)
MLFARSHFLNLPLFAALLLCATVLFQGAEVAAQSNPKIEGVMEQYRIERTADGKEARVLALNVRPGETLEYALRYTNKGETAVNQLVVTLPIPQGLELLSQSDAPRAPQASTDGVVFKEVPLKRSVKQTDGREVLESVPLSEYRALRWQIGQLPAGKSIEFAARAKVDASPARQ